MRQFSESTFSVGCVIPHDRPRFPFNDMEISMIDIWILDILIISILELFHAFFHAHKRRKSSFFRAYTPLSLSLAREKKSVKAKALHHVFIWCMDTLNLENEKNSMSLF